MPEIKRPLKVFLSYASQDRPVVRELSRHLAGEGWIDPWVDEKKLLPGQDWRLKIEEAVETSDAVIICLSSNSVTKEGYVQKELRYAREIALEKPDETIFLIPLRLDNCTVPRGLRFYQWGDYFGEVKDETYSTLLQSLKLRYEEKLRLEEEQRARQEREKQEREAAEKVAQEEAELERFEKAAQEKLEREAAEKARLEKAERDATEKAEQEKIKREAAEKAKRERAEGRATQIATLKETLSKSINSFKLTLPKAIPFLRIGGIIAIILVLLWFGSLVMPQLLTFMPTAEASFTPTHRPSATFTVSAQPSTKTATPKPTSTKTRTPSPTAMLGIGSTMISTKDGMTLLYVPAGEFTMGSDADDVVTGCRKFERVITDCQRIRFADEEPPHSVNVDAFWIDQTEVTNKMYENCVSAGACKAPSNLSSAAHSSYFGASEFENYPVIYVDWNMASDYCSWAGRRLPTEAEWEKVARGTDSSIYPWGNAFDGKIVNFCDTNCGIVHADKSSDDGYADVSPVGNYPSGQSIYGAYDMAGNVWEWVSSLYQPYPYDANDGRENLSSSDSRVLRGGSWNSDGNVVRAAGRIYTSPDNASGNFGFRCAGSP